MATQRVVCLYRVSTKGQVDDNDIPMQENACRNFIAKRNNWTLVDEYYEKGVSGYKKTASQRDILQQIKQDAIDKKFDVLLVSMFDRLGRREDESPFVLEWFTKQGIEMWSTQEGQQKFENHTDKLINYLRFWQSSGESIKTSIRTNEKLEQMAHEGLYNGGVAPYGYKLVPSGIINKKGKEIYKLEINEKESEIVKLIFEYASDYQYGKSRIAKTLNQNQHLPRNSNAWSAGTIGYILNNPIYKGYPAYGKKSALPPKNCTT